MFNLFVESFAEGVDRGSYRRTTDKPTSGDYHGQTRQTARQFGGLGVVLRRRVVGRQPLLLLLLQGLTWRQKWRLRVCHRTGENNKEEHFAICFLSIHGCAEAHLPLSRLFCPPQHPDAALLTHPLSSYRREDDDGRTKATVSCVLFFSVGR